MTKDDVKLLADAGYITDVTLFDDSVDLDTLLTDPHFSDNYINQIGFTEEVIAEILKDLKGETTEDLSKPEEGNEGETEEGNEGETEEGGDGNNEGEPETQAVAAEPVALAVEEPVVATTAKRSTRKSTTTTPTATE